MKLPIKLSKESREPIYHQVEKQLKTLIASGQLRAGVALPSIRVLSKDLEISVITTRKAYQNLELGGFIETMQGKGTFVAEIDETLKKETKEVAVHDTFQTAIETAMNYDYSYDEIKDIFIKLLKEKQGGNKK